MTALSAADLAALHRLGRMSLIARQAVEGLMGGQHRSRRRGIAVEFAGHREYQQGDDLRHLDWQVWARTDRFEVRQHEEESRLRVTIAIDGSGSMGFGDRFPRAVALAAALAWLSARRRDAVGMAVIDQRVRWFMAPGHGMGRLLRMYAALEAQVPEGPADLGAGLDALAARLHRRGLVVVISDGWSDPAAIGRGLAHLRHLRQDARLVMVRHRDELTFPFSGPLAVVGMEGEGLLRVDAERVRPGYASAVMAQRQALQAAAANAGAPVTWCFTDEELSTQLARCLLELP